MREPRPEGLPPDRKRIVAEGYDRIAERYAAWAAANPDPACQRRVDLLLEVLPAGAAVLGLGRGGRSPTTRPLAERFALTGVDISARQIALARENAPGATFVAADMAAVAFPPETLDAAAAFYALTHLPRAEQPALLTRIAGWLRPGGLFVATMGPGEPPNLTEESLGVPMFFGCHGAAENRLMVESAGLRTEEATVETTLEDDEPVSFLWVIARKPAAGAEGR